MKGRSVVAAPSRKTPWAAALVIDWTRVTVLLGAVVAVVLIAHSRLIEEPLTWITVAQYAAVLCVAGLAFAAVPRQVRGSIGGYAGACGLAGLLALLALAWLIEVDVPALLAPPAAAADRLGDVPLRNLASAEVRNAGPSVVKALVRAGLSVDPVYLALWAGIGAAGGAAYGWATRALR